MLSKSQSYHLEVDASTARPVSRICSRSLVRNGKLVTPSASSATQPSSPLLSLPAELQLDIIDCLDYEGAILLSSVNRHFHRIVRSQQWPQKLKLTFVKQAQRFRQHILWTLDQTSIRRVWNSERVHFACIVCCRVKQMQTFSAADVSHAVDTVKLEAYVKSGSMSIERSPSTGRLPSE